MLFGTRPGIEQIRLPRRVHSNQTTGIALSVETEGSLWVISGNDITPASCPFFPSKRTFISAVCTSA
jgi:hypothetical protein